MDGIDKELLTILTSQTLSNLASSKNIKIAEFDAIIAILLKTRIAFDVEYSPGTRRLAESALLRIYINPTTTLNFTFSFQSGSSLFGGPI
ncbi:MAG: hypothetical protein A2Y23_06605 [Clostridiales bacterium GWB2_37_7]|nr:MAG: hypothetical protein A2Y23_06605 [Clostridiales bacterium GWB2_37_7]